MRRDWWDRPFEVLFVFGESITAGGWASCRERNWASQLAGQISAVQRVPVQLVNKGIGANVISPRSPGYPYATKPAGTERVADHILGHRANGAPLLPDLLVISYGLNDARSGTPPDLFAAELGSAVRQVRQKIQPLIVLLGPYYMTDFGADEAVWGQADLDVFRQFNEATRQLAEELDCLFVDVLSPCQGADWLVHHDGVHGNDLGHRVVANTVFSVLACNCSGLAQESQYLEQQTPPWREDGALQTDSNPVR